MLTSELFQKKKFIFGEKTTDFFFLYHTLSRGYHCCITQISKEIGLYKGQAPCATPWSSSTVIILGIASSLATSSIINNGARIASVRYGRM